MKEGVPALGPQSTMSPCFSLLGRGAAAHSCLGYTSAPWAKGPTCQSVCPLFFEKRFHLHEKQVNDPQHSHHNAASRFQEGHKPTSEERVSAWRRGDWPWPLEARTPTFLHLPLLSCQHLPLSPTFKKLW